MWVFDKRNVERNVRKKPMNKFQLWRVRRMIPFQGYEPVPVNVSFFSSTLNPFLSKCWENGMNTL